jgi:penicillin-binding protein 1A
MMPSLRALARIAFFAIVIGVVVLGGAAAVTLFYFNRELPSHKQLTDYIPATGTKVYAADGSLMLELETEHRIPVPLAKIPPLLIHAVLAAEDRDFYNHKGVNPVAIFRAAMADIGRYQKGQRPMGASTITQQVVRHFLLTNEVSIVRKIKEMLLAYRIENELTKDRILEIYLNEIYFGAGAYGVAAAADTYFQKPLDKLTLAEAAFIAALPKAPNNYNAARHAKAAQARRDWVLSSMAEIGYITQDQAKAATAEPLGVHIRDPEGNQNGYFAEEVRRELIGRFGEKAVYEGGMTVRTSYMPNYQKMAEAAFRNGLIEYDRRHGWRGALAHLPNPQAAVAALPGMADPPGVPSWKLAAVTAVDAGDARVALRDGSTGRIALQDMIWARRTLDDQRLGAAVHRVQDVVQPGDIVLVEPAHAPVPAAPVKARYTRQQQQPAVETRYLLRQIPDVSGGVVAMDPKTGRVYALVGGWSFQQSQFDRATQAKRQPGSAFKPFVYVTALQNGFTPSSVVDDAPIELPQGPGQPPWRPSNYEGTYAGPSTLEEALVHSRNLVTARLATMVGLPSIAKTVQDFDIMDRMPLYYSMVLGAGETTLLRLTSAYAMLDNGGHWLLPSVVDAVQDRDGRVVYQKGIKGCAACFIAASPAAGAAPNTLYVVSGSPDPSWITVPNARYVENAVLYKPTKPDTMVNPDADTEIIAMMQGVVQRGTGTVVASVGKPLAGKTGTTSDWFDAWFVGFSPDLVAGVYVGFDEPRTLGGGEVGGRVAAPIFRDFMAAALKDVPAKEFPPPPPGSMPGAGAPTAALASANPDETPWGSLRPPGDEVTVLDGRTASRDASPPDWSQTSGAATPSYATPTAPDYRLPKSRASAPWQNPAYAAAPPTDTLQSPPDSAAPPDRAYRRPQNPAYAAAPPDYARQQPSDDSATADRRYERQQASGFSAVPRAYAAPMPTYTAPRAPAYPPYGGSGYGGGMPAYSAPTYGYGGGTPGYGTPGYGYGYGYPAGGFGPRPGTGGLY